MIEKHTREVTERYEEIQYKEDPPKRNPAALIVILIIFFILVVCISVSSRSDTEEDSAGLGTKLQELFGKASDAIEDISSGADSSVTLEEVGTTAQLSLEEESVAAEDITWVSSDSSIISVDSYGLVTAVSEGEATITAVYNGETTNFTVTCIVRSGIHEYVYTAADCTWSEAAAQAEAQGGHLVTLDSEEEFDYIVDEIETAGMSSMIFYLGATCTDETSYYWVDETGDLYGSPINSESAWCYDLWLDGEPSFTDSETRVAETVVTMFYRSGTDSWVFNDVPDNLLEAASTYSGRIAYICEFE